jgi:hypothetical protein
MTQYDSEDDITKSVAEPATAAILSNDIYANVFKLDFEIVVFFPRERIPKWRNDACLLTGDWLARAIINQD